MHKPTSSMPKHHTLQTFESCVFLYDNPGWYINANEILCDILEDANVEIAYLKAEKRALKLKVRRLVKTITELSH